jgi:hypothetical protein
MRSLHPLLLFSLTMNGPKIRMRYLDDRMNELAAFGFSISGRIEKEFGTTVPRYPFCFTYFFAHFTLPLLLDLAGLATGFIRTHERFVSYLFREGGLYYMLCIFCICLNIFIPRY